MKSFGLVFLSSLAIITSAVPDHFQSVPSLLCTDAPTQVTTVTVTKTASPITITEAAKIVSTSRSSTSSKHISFSTATTTTTAALAKKTIDVLVGAFAQGNGTNEFLFKPNNVTANIGDIVRFNMLGKAHSVTQSQFAKPCVHNGTFDTELQDNPMNKTGAIFEYFTVNVSTPLWFYCKQTVGTHCGRGMVFGINPKSQVQMQEFINLAVAQNGTLKASVSSSTTTKTSTVSTAMVKAPASMSTSTLHTTLSTAMIKLAMPTSTSASHSTTSASMTKTPTSTSTSIVPAVMSTGIVKVPMIKVRGVKPF
ncbi:hypothetical protein MMC30_006322 [Trapelia coarctata]|nr:hypothetical protein [Trapelia coarctata]